jgi:hypothetical protein
MESSEGLSYPRKLAVFGSSLVLGALAVFALTSSPIVAGLMALSAVFMSFFVLRATSYLRIALAVCILALVWVVGWLGMRSLGVVP